MARARESIVRDTQPTREILDADSAPLAEFTNALGDDAEFLADKGAAAEENDVYTDTTNTETRRYVYGAWRNDSTTVLRHNDYITRA